MFDSYSFITLSSLGSLPTLFLIFTASALTQPVSLQAWLQALGPLCWATRNCSSVIWASWINSFLSRTVEGTHDNSSGYFELSSDIKCGGQGHTQTDKASLGKMSEKSGYRHFRIEAGNGLAWERLTVFKVRGNNLEEVLLPFLPKYYDSVLLMFCCNFNSIYILEPIGKQPCCMNLGWVNPPFSA